MSDSLCNGTATPSVCTNSWQPYCSSNMYSVNLFVAANYKHMNIGSNVWVFVILDRTTYTLYKVLHRWVVCVQFTCMWILVQSHSPIIARCAAICWTTKWPIPKELVPLPLSRFHCTPVEFYGLQQKHNFIEANFIGKYGDERRCKSSTNCILLLQYNEVCAFWFECHWISSGPYFGIVNT